MKVRVSRANPILRMTDMYTMRFEGHPNRFICFRPEEWEKEFPKLQHGQAQEMELWIKPIAQSVK